MEEDSHSLDILESTDDFLDEYQDIDNGWNDLECFPEATFEMMSPEFCFLYRLILMVERKCILSREKERKIPMKDYFLCEYMEACKEISPIELSSEKTPDIVEILGLLKHCIEEGGLSDTNIQVWNKGLDGFKLYTNILCKFTEKFSSSLKLVCVEHGFEQDILEVNHRPLYTVVMKPSSCRRPYHLHVSSNKSGGG